MAEVSILPKLLGCWALLSGDGSIDLENRVEMEFRDSGELVYATRANDKWQLMLLTFRVDGSTIVSNQPSAPREERTRASFPADDQLELIAPDGDATSYARASACTHPDPK